MAIHAILWSFLPLFQGSMRLLRLEAAAQQQKEVGLRVLLNSETVPHHFVRTNASTHSRCSCILHVPCGQCMGMALSGWQRDRTSSARTKVIFNLSSEARGHKLVHRGHK
jgi:hypothetical protein